MKTTTQSNTIVRRSDDRSHANHGWLDTYHTFSFADYYDPDWVQFGSLRVLNEDTIAAGNGFPLHPHRDMEIFSFVPEGHLAHRDDLGNGSVIGPGRVQLMSAGRGIRHSEFNPTDDAATHLLQVWIMPRERGLQPTYAEKDYAIDATGLQLLASPDGAGDSMTIQQDIWISRGKYAKGATADLDLSSGSQAWLQLVSGELTVAGTTLVAGDGIGLTDAASVNLRVGADAEFLLFVMR